MWFDCMWTGIYRCVSCDEAVALNVCSSLVLRIYWHFVWSSDGGINTKMIRSIRRRWRCIWIALQFHMAMKFSHVFVCLFFSHVSMCVCSECHEVGFNTHFNGFVWIFKFQRTSDKKKFFGKKLRFKFCGVELRIYNPSFNCIRFEISATILCSHVKINSNRSFSLTVSVCFPPKLAMQT